MPLRLKIGSLFAIALMVFSGSHVAAAEQSSLTNGQIDRIRQNCVAAQVTLQRVQHSDVAVRINRGQAYDAVISKYIDRFNSRASLNNLSETSVLAERTQAIEMAIANFKQHYVEYEETLATTLKTKCQDRPVAFYDLLTTTRQQRQQLSKDITSIKAALGNYRQVVDSLYESMGGDV